MCSQSAWFTSKSAGASVVCFYSLCCGKNVLAVRMCWRFFCLFLLAVLTLSLFLVTHQILFFACVHAALSVSVPAFCLLCCRFFSLFCFTHQILFYAYHTHIIKMSDGGLLLCNDVMHSSILSAWFCCGSQPKVLALFLFVFTRCAAVRMCWR